MVISPLIVTYRRSAWLERCIRSLVKASEKISGLQLCAVILINGSDDDTAQVIARLASEFPEFISKVILKSERATPAKARNEALPHAKGEWVLFIDDDAFVEENFFRAFLTATVEFPRSVAIGGPNLTPVGSSSFQIATGMILSSRLGAYSSFARYRKVGTKRSCNEESLILCNLFVKRNQLGAEPFPERLLCSEENWLLQSLRGAGHELTYHPEMPVFHERRAGLFSFSKQVFLYGFGRGQNIKMRPHTFRWVHIFPGICTIAGVLALFVIAAIHTVPTWIFYPFATYFFLCLLAVVTQLKQALKNLPAAFVAVFLFPVLHVSYGAGVLLGVLHLNQGSLPFRVVQ